VAADPRPIEPFTSPQRLSQDYSNPHIDDLKDSIKPNPITTVELMLLETLAFWIGSKERFATG
jgi:hypothetical protein